MNRVRVLFVDDSAVIRGVLRELLASDPVVEMAGIAPDGLSAPKRTEESKPDLVTLDVEVPGMSALAETATTNVVDVCVNYVRREMDVAYDRRLIRSVRGTGYQIGTNGLVS